MKIAIGCDEAACDMKTAIQQMLLEQGHQLLDFGTHDHRAVLYPDIGVAVANRGLLFCGTGIGMAISANKVQGIRAAQAHDTYSAERASKSNNAQILCVGARVVGLELAKVLVQTFLNSDPEPRSHAKLEALAAHERRLRHS